MGTKYLPAQYQQMIKDTLESPITGALIGTWAAGHVTGISEVADVIALVGAIFAVGDAALVAGPALYDWAKKARTATTPEELRDAGKDFALGYAHLTGDLLAIAAAGKARGLKNEPLPGKGKASKGGPGCFVADTLVIMEEEVEERAEVGTENDAWVFILEWLKSTDGQLALVALLIIALSLWKRESKRESDSRHKVVPASNEDEADSIPKEFERSGLRYDEDGQ